MCVEVMRTSHRKRKLITCPPKWCACGHLNYGHGPGGCSGETRRGCCWVSCNCVTFVAGEVPKKPENSKYIQQFGTRHQG